MRKVGISEEEQKIIVDYILKGNFFDTACQCAGINPSTGRAWLRHGKMGKSEQHISFYNAITEAKAICEARMIGIVQNAAVGVESIKIKVTTEGDSEKKEVTTEISSNWNAARWYLEKACSKRWGATGELNNAISTLQKYGIKLQQDEEGNWTVEND